MKHMSCIEQKAEGKGGRLGHGAAKVSVHSFYCPVKSNLSESASCPDFTTQLGTWVQHVFHVLLLVLPGYSSSWNFCLHLHPTVMEILRCNLGYNELEWWCENGSGHNRLYAVSPLGQAYCIFDPHHDLVYGPPPRMHRG
jgi:hypothetical protein